MKTAWFGEQKLKDEVMIRLEEDRRLDRFIQGEYWDSGRGCHLGCLTRNRENPHSSTERMFGIPLHVAHWLEAVFEGLPKDKCAWWVIEGTNSIPVGADLSLAHHRLAVWLLGPESPSAVGNSHHLVADAVANVRSYHEKMIAGEYSRSESAESAAWSAESVARSAARSVAWSAAWSAESVARSAGASARSAESVARSAAWVQIASKSIEILSTSPIMECEACDESAQQTMSALV